MAVNSRDEILKYLGDCQAQYQSYHNHKETSAWGGLVLSVALLLGVTSAVDKGAASSFSLRLIAAIIVIGLALTTWVYLRQQFSLRRRAANLVSACLALRTEMVSSPNIGIDPSEYTLPKTGDLDFQSSHVLPQLVLRKAENLDDRGQGARKRLEGVAYGFLAITALLAAARIYFEV